MSKKPRVQKVETGKINKLQQSSKPIFSFEYLQDDSIMICRDHGFFTNFLKRLRSLSSLSWSETNRDKRHGYGWEKISVKDIKVDTNKCRLITDDVKSLLCFRATGNNHVFLGLRDGDTFHVIYIEANFGDIYDH